MKKLFLALTLSLVSISLNAQDYGPGSPYWEYQMQQRINAMQWQNFQMQQQILQYYNNQANAATHHMMTNPLQPMQGVYTYDGVYLTPNNVNKYRKKKVDCENCDGGYIYKKQHAGNGRTKTVKSRCRYCHGNGKITKTVPISD